VLVSHADLAAVRAGVGADLASRVHAWSWSRSWSWSWSGPHLVL